MTCSTISTTAGPSLDGRPSLAGDDVLDEGRDRRPVGQVVAEEDDPGIPDPAGPEPELDVEPLEEADPLGPGIPGDRSLRTTGDGHARYRLQPRVGEIGSNLVRQRAGGGQEARLARRSLALSSRFLRSLVAGGACGGPGSAPAPRRRRGPSARSGRWAG